MRLATALLCSAALALCAAAPAAADPGGLSYFKTYPELLNGNRSGLFSDGVVQPDGMVVLGGWRYNKDNFADADGILARVNPATGALDVTFGTGGFAVVPVNQDTDGNDFISVVEIGPDGRIYFAGQADQSSGTDAFVGVYTSAGQPYAPFGPNGIQTFDFQLNGSDRAESLVVDANGTVTVGGLAFGMDDGFGLARFDATGQPVNTFGTSGKVVTPLGGSGSDAAQQLFDTGNGTVAALGVADISSPGSEPAFVEYSSLGAVTRSKLLPTSGTDFRVRGIWRPTEALYLIRTGNVAFTNIGEVLGFTPALDPLPDFGSQPFGQPSFGTAIAAALNGFTVFGARPGDGVSSDEFVLANLDVGGKVTGTVKTYPTSNEHFERPYDLIVAGGKPMMIGGQGGSGAGAIDVPAIAVPDDSATPGTGTTPKPRAIDHYHVELKAWIPHMVVVDPRKPIRVPWILNALGTDCFAPPLLSKEVRVRYVRLFEGDGHRPYDGPFRAYATLDFDWDGTQILNATSTTGFGETRIVLEYLVASILGDSVRTVTCVLRRGQATALAEARAEGGSGFLLRLETANPLVALSPTIDDKLTGSVAGQPPESAVSITWLADIFPSHGWQVFKNGVRQATVTHVDAGCLGAKEVRGIGGAARIGWGLTHQDATGTIALGPREAGRKEERPSPLCSRSYWLAQPAELKKAIFGSSAVPTVTVAPIVNGKRGTFVPLATAEKQGLVEVERDGDQLSIFSSPLSPVALRVRGRKPALRVAEVKHGVEAAGKLYTGARDLIAEQGTAVKVTSGGKTLKARKADIKPPVTTAKVKVKGKKATIRFRSKDPSGVAALNVTLDGKTLKLRRGAATVATSKLNRVRYFAVDVFGNEEAPKRPRR